MKIIKSFLLITILIALCTPIEKINAQSTQALFQQTDETTNTKDKKADKKKDKDVVEINEVFYISLAINLVTVLLLILLIYYPNNKHMDYIFSFIIFNLVIFLLTYVLNQVKISIGAAFGLFAVFSMLRYRTEGISIKDMTYLFIFIAVGLISAIQLEYYELIILNSVVIVGAFILDGNILIKLESSKLIDYDVIENIKPENKAILLEDIQNRTGLKIHKLSICDIDFLKDSAQIRVYYYEK